MNDETISSVQSIEEISKINCRIAELEHHLLKELAEKDVLIEQEKQFRRLVESISDVIFEVDHQGMVLYFSPVGKDIWGYDWEDVVGKNFMEFVHPDDWDILNYQCESLRRTYVGSASRGKNENTLVRWNLNQALGKAT